MSERDLFEIIGSARNQIIKKSKGLVEPSR